MPDTQTQDDGEVPPLADEHQAPLVPQEGLDAPGPAQPEGAQPAPAIEAEQGHEGDGNEGEGGEGDEGEGGEAQDRSGSHFRAGRGRAPWSTGFSISEEHTGWEALAIGLASLVLALVWFRHAWAHPVTSQVGVPGDAQEYDWFLTWAPWAIVHGHNPLLSGFVNAPSGVNLMWNTSVLLPSLIFSPVTRLAGATLSYNILITAAPAFSTALCYVAFRRWCARLPCLAGAFFFGFSPYFSTQAPGHLAQVLLMSVPLMLILGDRIFSAQRGRAWLDGLLLGLLAWAQLLTGEELLAMEAIVAFFTVIVLAAINARTVRAKLAYALRSLGVCVVTFVVLATPFLYTQFAGPYQTQGEHPGNAYVTDALNFIVPTNATQLAPQWAQDISNQFYAGEHGSYIGIPLLALALSALVLARRRRVTWVAFALALVAGVLSMGSTLHYYGHNTQFLLPDNWLQKLPSMKNLLPVRFASITDLGVALLVALALTGAARVAWPLRAGTWAVGLLGLALVFPIWDYPASPTPNYHAYTTGWVCPPAPDDSGGYPGRPPVALVVPAGNEMQLLWQLDAHFCFSMPTARGLAGTSPVTKEVPAVLAWGSQGVAAPPASVTPALRAQFAQALQAYRVKEVIVSPVSPASPAPAVAEPQLVAFFQELLGRAPETFDDPSPTYAWKVLPPYSQIATGHFTGT